MPPAHPELTAIALRLEASAGGAALLDAAVHAVVNAVAQNGFGIPQLASAGKVGGDEIGGDMPALPYTRSLDAATKLVPPWALWSVRALWSGQDYERTAFVATVTAFRFPEQTVRFSRDGQGKTAALALCAAALRVMAARS